MIGVRALVGLVSALCLSPSLRGADLQHGGWKAHLDSPGGELEFRLRFAPGDLGSRLRAELFNGSECIQVPVADCRDGRMLLDFVHYDSRIEASLDESGTRLDGTWRKRLDDDRYCEMPFHAVRDVDRSARDQPAASERRVDEEPKLPALSARYRVRFSSSPEPAVALFEADSSGQTLGTFLTSTGDYRYLAGEYRDGSLRLSCFDGAHAFLFHARSAEDGTLSGDFWSRDQWHETWTAVPDAAAALDDPFAVSTWLPDADLRARKFRDLDGNVVALGDARLAGKLRILQLFGSWCPNCHDASEELMRLQRKYAARGLSIVGLAFEITGDFERNAQMVRRYAERHQIEYPLLIAGSADKARATVEFGALDQVRAFPTTIFLDADGKPLAVYTGFCGPASGPFFEAQRERFEQLIESGLQTVGSRPRR